MTANKKEIFVYADWEKFKEPFFMGTLSAVSVKGREVFSFEYTKEWLKAGRTEMLDPDLQLYEGRYFPKEEKQNFGVFLDSCPDRWGRVLMDEREAVLARHEERPLKHLLESDYLLGVYDAHRKGAIRYKLNIEGDFLNDDLNLSTPTWTSLRELEHASLKFEEGNTKDKDYLKWISLLIAPGSSLGGVRPKAGVMDAKGHPWIAKFPSLKDEKDIGAWEMVVNKLATKAGLTIAEGTILKFRSKQHTFLTKRFDRTKRGDRIHFASALTLLGYTDGASGDTGASYLEIAEFIMKHGADVTTDLEELWRRIVFNICIKNTDDHLRNHGFLLTDSGWKLSPAYDINPNEFGSGLSLNISEKDNSLDLELALSVAEYFRVGPIKSKKIVNKVKTAVTNWQKIAKEIGISRVEQERVGRAFEEPNTRHL